MSTTVYLIRHGESEANEHNVFLGQGNMDLTAIGKHQAEMAAQYLKNAVKPDFIYSSDLTRAYDTARFTAEKFDMPIIKDTALREINAGYWDKLTFEEIEERYPESFEIWKSDVGSSRCDGGESVGELWDRFISAVTDIAKRHDGATVLIFTHATPIRIFGAFCLGKSLAELKDMPWAANASVTKAEFDGKFQLSEYSIDYFMGDSVTRLPSGV